MTWTELLGPAVFGFTVGWYLVSVCFYLSRGFWGNYSWPSTMVYYAQAAIRRSIKIAENQPKPWNKLSAVRKRERRQRRNAKLRDYVLMGKVQVTPELMQFIQSPKWRAKIVQAVILRQCNPEQAYKEGSKRLHPKGWGKGFYQYGYRSACQEK